MLTVELYSIAMYSMTSFSREEPILPSRQSVCLSIYTERRILSDPWWEDCNAYLMFFAFVNQMPDFIFCL